MFIDALANHHRDSGQLVGMCDPSRVRMEFYQRRLRAVWDHPPVATCLPDGFGAMLSETRADAVIVCTIDAAHHTYVVRAMEAGCDVICEKPLTTDADKARQIAEAMRRTGRSLRVTFNLRYTPWASRVRGLIADGAVGRPTAVDLSWTLDTGHGADYFRRWHREKDESGGLLVHKATHHFDLVNWWLDSRPATVYAMGGLRFYGEANAKRRGERYGYDRYTGEPGAAGDPFALRLEGAEGPPPAGGAAGSGAATAVHDDVLRGLYLDAEAETGYVRDRNVFGRDITIEDTMAVMARYDSGVVLNYSLLAYSPWEGLRVAITGDRGRVELFVYQGSHVVEAPAEAGADRPPDPQPHETLTVFPMFGRPYTVEVPRGEGGHGGGDPAMLDDLFSPDTTDDPLRRAASAADGIASLLVGMCANESIRTGEPVTCRDVFDLAHVK